MKLNKKDRNKEYRRILSGLYAAEEIHTTFYLCHALGHLSFEYRKLLEEYPELEILFPVDFNGGALLEEHNDWKEESYVLREIILQFAIAMTE